MDVQCLGKGKLLEELSGQQKIYQVQFKQTFDYFYVQQEDLHFQLNDRVIVEGDRGYDLGRVVGLSDKTNTPTDRVKRLFRHANSAELITYEQKGYDEQKALTLCQSKIKQKNLDMKIIDAEYQWDRRKLTFYFKANERVDFRELVKELFKIYKTRIWMCAYSPNEK
ncbi:PSP1 C-terminal conserved region-domain-containing protein [Blakeslea trispora]|nr:PSP1 C-terminal conserved region-domain-containing protein [Blakeslea trispora]